MNSHESSFLKAIILFPFKALLFLLEAALIAGILLAGWLGLQMYGVFPVRVPVSGASMLPTLPTDGSIAFQKYMSDIRIQSWLPQNLNRGDIVVFENAQTDQELKKQHKSASGFVKRIIGIPGDTIKIQDGTVFVNNEALKEQYTLKPRSTFGGTEVADCQDITVPDGKLFVLGDNRKLSMDSREIGLVKIQDIQYYIPYTKQPGQFGTNWRDPADDLDTENESLFDVNEYLRLLNAERSKHDLKPLSYEPKLEQSAKSRAKVMLEYDDFSFEATTSKYNMQKAMSDAGYQNIVFGEFPMTGYYEAKELFDAFVEQRNSHEFLLKKDYSDIGVSTFVGELRGCPVQVVVQHLAGYVPPNYKQADIQGWRDGFRSLKDIQPGWQKLKEYEEFYQKNKSDIERVNEILTQRIERYQQIITRMESNEWLTTQEKAWIDQDGALIEEQNNLAKKLNAAQ